MTSCSKEWTSDDTDLALSNGRLRGVALLLCLSVGLAGLRTYGVGVVRTRKLLQALSHRGQYSE